MTGATLIGPSRLRVASGKARMFTAGPGADDRSMNENQNPNPNPLPPPPPRSETPKRRLTRSSDDKMIGGVAGGLGRHLDVDPVLVRLAFVILALFGGSGLLLYALAWIIIPSDCDDLETQPVNADTTPSAAVAVYTPV